MTLTREKVIQFLQNSWNINDVELLLQKDRAHFLNKLIATIYERVPFHVLIAYMPPEWPNISDFDDVDEMCMSGFGGQCVVINFFTWRLLTALGYSAYICLTTVTSTRTNPHIIVIVKDLVNTGDIHVVDCGLGQPSFTAISLNFHKESAIYQESYLEYKFIKHDGKILRMHGNGDLVKHNDPPIEGLDLIIGKWRRYYAFTLTERIECKSIDNLRRYVDLRPIRRLFSPRAAIFRGGKAVMVLHGDALFIERDDRTLEETTLKSHEEIFKAWKENFPTINKDLVQLAYSTWQKSKL